jgi:hypothetical protein
MTLSKRDRRLVMIGGPVLVLVLVWFVFLRGGSKSPTSAAPPLGNTTTAPVAHPSPTPSPGTSPLLVFAGRDPFAPLIVAAPTNAGATVSPAGAPPAGGGGGSSATIGGKTVTLDSIFTVNGVQKAQVEVNGTVYTVAPGETFAGSYKLVSINGTCANFTWGDQSFSLCETANK